MRKTNFPHTYGKTLSLPPLSTGVFLSTKVLIHKNLEYVHALLLKSVIIMRYTSPCRDRFRTTVNVLGDTFGVGIVEHHSRKQLGPFPKPLLQQNETAEESSDSFPNDHFHRRSPDYGTSTSPPPTLQQIPSSEWSVCSHESGQMAGMSSHSEVSGCTMGVGGHAEGAAEGASENGPVSGNQKRLSGSSFGSLDIQESTNL